jgi:hypothetical protein
VHRLHRLKRVPVFFAVALFLALQTVALTHELDHALSNHDSPTCALHLFGDHGGKSLTSVSTPGIAPNADAAPIVARAQLLPRPNAVPFQSRAPPLSVV